MLSCLSFARGRFKKPEPSVHGSRSTSVLDGGRGGDWNRGTWHRETNKIVGTDIAVLDIVALHCVSKKHPRHFRL